MTFLNQGMMKYLKRGMQVLARITRYKIKADAVEAARAEMEAMKDDIMALDGMVQFISAMKADGEGYVVSLVREGDVPDSDSERVRALWGRMAPYLDGVPQPARFDVVAWWEQG